jgi:hypothetical protein
MTRRPMTESDWLRSADPRAMLDCLFGPRSEGSAPDLPRKLRLYLTALGRKHWRRMPWAGRTLVALAERMADGWEPTETEYAELFHLAERFAGCGGDPGVVAGCDRRLACLGFGGVVPADPPPAAIRPGDWEAVARLAFVPLFRRLPVDNWVAPHLHDADLVRDIFRHPDRPARFAPEWRTTAVAGLAAGMYHARDFSGTPALADALAEAGCDDADILAHCRAADPHVRGCWVLDLILDPSPGPRGVPS